MKLTSNCSPISGGIVAQIRRCSPILCSSLISETEEPTLEYRVGVSNGFEDHTEYGRPDAKRSATTGTMIPLLEKDRALKWTWDFLKKARRAQIDGDIASAMADLSDMYQQLALTRLFKSTADTVGSSGKAVPVADAGTADSSYIPVNHPERASAFASSHTHLLNTMTVTQANLEVAVAHLWEHGHDAPYDLWIAQADVASWSNTTNVTGWIKRADGLIRYGTQADLANVAGDYIAVVETSVYGPVRVRASADPNRLLVGVQIYGTLDARNRWCCVKIRHTVSVRFSWRVITFGSSRSRTRSCTRNWDLRLRTGWARRSAKSQAAPIRVRRFPKSRAGFHPPYPRWAIFRGG